MTDQSATARPTTVWTEIPVADLDAAKAFYEQVFGWTMQKVEMGPNPVMMFAGDAQGVHGHLYAGKPAGQGQGPTVHLAVPGTLSEAVDTCKAAGGTVLSPPIEIPAGRFAYAQDPDGNSLGLFEVAA